MKEQKYIIENINSFELPHILECGQCFRWNEEDDDGSYTGIVGNNVINVSKISKLITFTSFDDIIFFIVSTSIILSLIFFQVNKFYRSNTYILNINKK